MNTREVGDLGERIAECYLRLKGYEIVRRNYRYAGREIDLLARKGVRLVAVEVKLRRGNRFGNAVESIDRNKVARLRTALAGALAQARRPLEAQVDVVVIDVSSDRNKMSVRHLEAVDY